MIPKPLKIVIAEDDLDDGEIMLDSFSRHPHFNSVQWVKNGRELLDFLADPQNPKPDVILTDINMPIMSGIEALEKICSDPKLASIPSFVYSSTLNPVYEVRCMKLGTKGFLIKPLNLREFDEIPHKIVLILENSMA